MRSSGHLDIWMGASILLPYTERVRVPSWAALSLIIIVDPHLHADAKCCRGEVSDEVFEMCYSMLPHAVS